MRSRVAPPAPQTPPLPAPITSVNSYDFVPKTSSSTQSAPAEQRSGSAVSGDSGARGSSNHNPVTASAIGALDAQVKAERTQFGQVTNQADLKNQFLTAGWTSTQVASDVILFDQRDSKGNLLVAAGTPILEANRPVYAPIVRKNLDRAGLVLGDSLYMNLYNARYDGVAIGGDAEDGIDFLTETATSITGFLQSLGGGRTEDTRIITENRFYYAGILSGTDLGVPVSTTDPTAIWNGSFRTDDARYPVDFRLTVTFGTTDGTRTISAFVKDTATRAGANDYYLLAGTYTDAGVITGTVNYGEFTGGERNAPTGDRTPGTIKGLIGVEGAVGVFISDAAESTVTNKITSTITFTNGYVGGFVASASLSSAERVLYNDWFESFDDPTTGGVHETPSLRAEVTGEDAETGDDTFTNQFLATREGADALDETGAGTVTEKGGLTLADDADSGVSFFSNGITFVDGTPPSAIGNSYAGLLSGTDLGAPINNADQVGDWKGQFKSVGGYYYADPIRTDTRVETAIDDTDFTLTVTFSGGTGTVNAFVPIDQAGRHFYITGAYDANGVITGYVQAANFNTGRPTSPLTSQSNNNGILTGLIGAEGAVGAFHSNADNYNYAGGFVATEPEPVVPTFPEYSTFVEHYGAQLPEGRDEMAGGSGFLRGTSTTLNTDGLDLSSGLTVGPVVVRLGEVGSEHADYNSGFVVLRDNGNKYRAGLLSDTDLGAVLTSDVTASWSGKAYAIRRAGIGSGDLTLTVDFNAGTINTTTAAVLTNNAGSLTVRGRFRTGIRNTDLPDGILGGTVSYGSFNNVRLIGLIGDKGVLGVFHPGSDQQSVGGFYATPAPTFPKYSSFVEHYGSRLNADLTTGGVYAFLEGTETGLNMTGLTSSASINAIKLGGDADSVDGFSIIRGGTATTNPVLRAGLLSGTDLGAVLDNPASITWNGSIHLLGSLLGDSSKDDLTLTVDFAAGTIVATAATVGTGGFGISGSVAINGQFGSEHGLPDGILGGNVVHNSGTPLPLIGLIGEEGVIGVFHSNRFVGGFQATPTPASVTFADWEASFETGGVNASETLQNKGFTGGFGARNYVKLDASGNVLENSTILNTTILRLNGATSQGDDGYESGFAYASSNRSFAVYAGLLSTTNVGPKIENTDLNGTWNGSLGGVANNGGLRLSSDDFKLRVNFGDGLHAGTITTFGFNPSAFGDTAISGKRFTVNGNFNTDGVMWGDVGLATVSGFGVLPPVNGVFSGLIGQNGAVGVFKGVDGGGYAGGFVVKPPSD